MLSLRLQEQVIFSLEEMGDPITDFQDLTSQMELIFKQSPTMVIRTSCTFHADLPIVSVLLLIIQWDSRSQFLTIQT